MLEYPNRAFITCRGGTNYSRKPHQATTTYFYYSPPPISIHDSTHGSEKQYKLYLLKAGSCDINESDQSKLGKIKVDVA
jgi:hypothetical protein